MRCYNGCPDSALQALLDDSERATKQLAAIGARATYFPVEQGWLVFRDLERLTDNFQPTKRAAADAVLKGLAP